jgi:hypothetical protein
MNDREEIVAEQQRTMWRIIETWIEIVKRQERKIELLERQVQLIDGLEMPMIDTWAGTGTQWSNWYGACDLCFATSAKSWSEDPDLAECSSCGHVCAHSVFAVVQAFGHHLAVGAQFDGGRDG